MHTIEKFRNDTDTNIHGYGFDKCICSSHDGYKNCFAETMITSSREVLIPTLTELVLVYMRFRPLMNIVNLTENVTWVPRSLERLRLISINIMFQDAFSFTSFNLSYCLSPRVYLWDLAGEGPWDEPLLPTGNSPHCETSPAWSHRHLVSSASH